MSAKMYLKNRKGERGSFTGASVGKANDVTSSQDGRNAAALHLRGLVHAQRFAYTWETYMVELL